MRGRMPRHDDLLERLMAKVRTKKQSSAKETGANLGFEAKLWQASDALRNNMDAAEYKHVVLGLIFLKYISDAFEAKHDELVAQTTQGADPEDPDEYRAASIFWVPKEARWAHLKARAPQPEIGQIVDNAMAAIEQDNPSLKVSCRRITHGQVWTSNGLASSSISSAISDWAAPPIAPRIFSAVSTNTSSPNSQAPKARRADSSNAVPRGACAGRNARSIQGTRLRSLLRFRRDVCVEREVHRSAQRQDRRHFHLRSGVELHHVASGEDESRDTRHRRSDRPRRHVSQRPASGSQGGLRARQSAIQRQ